MVHADRARLSTTGDAESITGVVSTISTSTGERETGPESISGPMWCNVTFSVRNEELLFWEERMRAVSDELIVCTDDGSYGRKALVTAPLKEILEAERPIDRIWAVGPAVMKILRAYQPTVWRARHRQSQFDHGGRHRHVWGLPRGGGRTDALRVRGWARVRRTSGGLEPVAGPSADVPGRGKTGGRAVAAEAPSSRLCCGLKVDWRVACG